MQNHEISKITEWASHLERIQISGRRQFVRAGLEACRSVVRPGSQADAALQLAQTAIQSTQTLEGAELLLTRLQRHLILNSAAHRDGTFDTIFIARLILISTRMAI